MRRFNRYSRRMNSNDAPMTQKRSRFRVWAGRMGLALLGLGLLFTGRVAYSLRDRTQGYSIRLDIPPQAAGTNAPDFRVGFGRVDITPKVGQGAPPVWMAGFSQGRAATGVHDPLSVTALVMDDGHVRVGVAVLDAIGFFYDDVIAVRRACEAELKLNYTIVCSTHNHSTPDLMGLWGPNPFESGIDVNYRERVIQSAAQALRTAAGGLQVSKVSVHEIQTPPDGLVADTRKPQVFDCDLRVMLFRNATGDAVIGSMVGWGNHPETPWAKNTELTADFPGVLRNALENGIHQGNQVAMPGLGGMHLFVNGAVGGLMTTHPSITVRDPFSGQEFKTPSHDKTQALGHQLARRILDRVSNLQLPASAAAPIGIHARTIEVPVGNHGFLAGSVVGVLNRGHSSWMKMKTEVAVLTVGEASIACIPGEIYPEIVNGGVERAPGGDYDVPPVEIPSIREMMPGKVKFVFGLANDEMGYIIPRSEWDQKPPYLYGAKGAPYGEVNSVGPDTAPLIHASIKTLCEASRADMIVASTFLTAFRGSASEAAVVPSHDVFVLQAARCRRLLKSSVVDFYLPHCVDTKNGGYLEEMKEGRFVSSDQKFLTLQARQLWSFSVLAGEDAALRATALAAAQSGFEFIEGKMRDAQGGGYFAKVSDVGKPIDDRKHAYLNSFALYGLAAYHRATGDPRALKAAQELFQVFETRFRDERNGGYHEFFHRDWTPVVDEKESRYVGVIGTKTYNTHLHLLESFAELYRVWPDAWVARRVQELILINTSTLMDPKHHCNVDGWWPDWRRVETPENLRASYGHDVECAWLVIDAADAVGLSRRPLVTWASSLIGYSLAHGYDREHGGFFYSGPLGGDALDTRKEWWVEAEALVGLLTLYRETRQPEYFARFQETLDFIERHHIAKEGGWWATLKADGSATSSRSRSSMWQGAYHSGRALLSSAKILEKL